MFVPVMPTARDTSLINRLSNLALLTNLKLCVDAGDLNSYDGSSQTWKDLSGNGSDFYRGSGSGSDSSDPTFNGTAGRESGAEYFSGDGGDYFTLTSNPSWVDALHKSGGKFTFAEWTYLNGIASTANPFGNAGSASATGAGVIVGSSVSTNLALSVVVAGDSATTAYSKKSTTLATNGQWNFLAVAVDIAAGTVLFHINGTAESYTSQSFSGLSANPASQALTLGSEEGNTAIDNNGCRCAQFAMWNTAISAANLTLLFNSTRARFGV